MGRVSAARQLPGQEPGARQPGAGCVAGTPDQVGTAPGLPRLPPLPTRLADPRARSALTLNHGNGAGPRLAEDLGARDGAVRRPSQARRS